MTSRTAARRLRRRGACRAMPGLAVRGFASSGLPGPKGNRETFVHGERGGEPVADIEAAIARGGAVSERAIAPPSRDPHRGRASPTPSPSRPASAARDRRSPRRRRALRGLRRATRSSRSTATPPAGIEPLDALDGDPDLCLVLGGDGTILKALRRFAGTEVPVFGVNFGTIGFLAAVERDELETGSPARSRASSR